MNMIKCTLQFCSESKQHYPGNQYFTIIIIPQIKWSQIKSNVGFWWEKGKTGVPGKNLSKQSTRTNKLDPMASAEIEPGPHWWKASALTTWGQPYHQGKHKQ